MNYTITINNQFKSLEVSFDTIPNEKIRAQLKGLKFRWHSVKKIWYGFADIQTVKSLLDGKKAPESNKPIKASHKPTAEQKALLAKYFGAIWESEKMQKYELNHVDKVLQLGSDLIIWDKQGLETDFCFGYGFYGKCTEEEVRNASDAAIKARTDGEYFKKENLERVNEKIEKLKDKNTKVYIYHYHFTGEKPHNLSKYSVMKSWHEFEKDCENFGTSYRIATDEERAKILEVEEEIKQDRIKRIDTYLKKYGTSKLNVWTYLVD